MKPKPKDECEHKESNYGFHTWRISRANAILCYWCFAENKDFISIAEVEKKFGCSLCEAKAVKDCWNRHAKDVMLTGDNWKNLHEAKKG